MDDVPTQSLILNGTFPATPGIDALANLDTQGQACVTLISSWDPKVVPRDDKLVKKPSQLLANYGYILPSQI